jgi:hypothetical protein
VHSVLIEPLASMAAVEDFLWPRVQRTAEDAGKEAAAIAKATAAATRAEVGSISKGSSEQIPQHSVVKIAPRCLQFVRTPFCRVCHGHSCRDAGRGGKRSQGLERSPNKLCAIQWLG